ncbi:hypothetical protein GCK32_017775 [Trichostrongylus colubriformis]|uniref:Uncharacterized protein n=1 Tax=Trichostrongylus colubriformis TaxID=6319 RepID=A0AAN8G4H3_TRICO
MILESPLWTSLDGFGSSMDSGTSDTVQLSCVRRIMYTSTTAQIRYITQQLMLVMWFLTTATVKCVLLTWVVSCHQIHGLTSPRMETDPLSFSMLKACMLRCI